MTVPDVRAQCKLASTLGELRPEQPRPLTVHELQQLYRLGFETLARQLAAGTCNKCGMNKAGTGHRQMCIEPEEARSPKTAEPPPLQPWEPRPSTRLRKAA